MDISLITWLKDGEYRQRILTLLSKENLLPSEIAIKLQINRASVSRILRDLKGKKLVEEISSSGRTKSYILTHLGKSSVKYTEVKNE